MINLDWDKVNGLMPAIVQDHETLEILMLGYMNKEALEISQSTGLATFFSRTYSRSHSISIKNPDDDDLNKKGLFKNIKDCLLNKTHYISFNNLDIYRNFIQ